MADDLTLKGLNRAALIPSAEVDDVGKTDEPPKVEDDDHFERRERATQQLQNAPRKPWLASQLATLIGRHRPVVAGVLLAIAVPTMTGCTSTFTRAPTSTEVIAAKAKADLALTQPLFVDANYRAHVSQLRQSLMKAGLPSHADDVPIWVLTDHAKTGESMVRVIGDRDVGIAPGADVHLKADAPALDSDHQQLRGRVNDGLTAVAQGSAINDALIRDLGQLLIFDAAAQIQNADESRIQGRTNLAVLSMDQSPLDMAQRLLTALNQAPEGSAAHTMLAGFGDEAIATQLADHIGDVLDRKRGQRAIASAEWKLENVLEEARSNGLLVLRAAGDSRVLDEGSMKAHSRPLANDLEHLLTIGAVASDGDMQTSSAFGVVTVSAATPEGTEGSAAYTTAGAALMLATRPNATPDQLQHILTNPRSRRNIEETGRDGLGQINIYQAVSLASQKSSTNIPSDPLRYRALQVMKSAPDIAEDHTYVAHINHVHQSLADRGLPTRGDGVQVFVVEVSWGQHGGNVLRTIADEDIGLAPGADVHLITDSPWYSPRERTLSKRVRETRAGILQGNNFSDSLIVDIAERSLLSRASTVRQIANRVDGSQTSFVNMSYGTTSSSIASGLLEYLADAPEGSDAAKTYAGLGDTDAEREHALIKRVGAALAKPSARIKTAREHLTAEIRNARAKRVMVFTSAGNARDEVPHTDRGYSAHVSDGIPGLIVIGATDFFDPTNFDDDRITDFSSEGRISAAAPGALMPIKINGADSRGTSYSSPYAVATGVLMVAANADLTPDEIEALLLKSTHNIPTTLDGAGVINPIEAATQASLH